MSEETVKAFEELAVVEQEIETWQMKAVVAADQLTIAKEEMELLVTRKRELLKVVKIVRVRKPKPEPEKKPRKERADKGRKRGYLIPPASAGPETKASGDSEGIDPVDQKKIDDTLAALDKRG
jgi:hypothetical protein